jgi:hypothetical protein
VSDPDPLVRSLRGALAREAEAVTPDPLGLQRIRTAIAERERGRRRVRRGRVVTLSAALAGVAVVAGVVFATSNGPARPPRPSQVNPAATPAPVTSATAVNPVHPTDVALPDVALPVYYPGLVGAGYRLFREFHSTPAGGSGGGAISGSSAGAIAARVQAAVTQALSRAPDDPDYRTLWATGADARTTVLADRISIVLNEAAAGGLSVPGTSADGIAIQQLVWTATAAAAPAGTAGPALVQLRADGPTPERLGSIDLTRPFRRDSAAGDGDPRAPVWIVSIGQDAAVPAGRFTVRGEGAGAASPLRWSLSQAGREVRSGTMTATTQAGARLAVGVRGQWTLALDLPTAGRYTLAVTQGDCTDSKDFKVFPPL